MNALDTVLENVTDNLDNRRFEITKLRRVASDWVDKPLESTFVSMAIVMVYAHWEGYVKEVCQLYLEYVESTVPKSCDLHADILGYLWTQDLRPLVGGLNSKRKRKIAELSLQSHLTPVAFSDAEKTIGTKSNLTFSVLKQIGESLCLDTVPLEPWGRHLDSLVSMRNSIAHGYRPRGLVLADFEERAAKILELMEATEKSIMSALSNRTFCTT